MSGNRQQDLIDIGELLGLLRKIGRVPELVGFLPQLPEKGGQPFVHAQSSNVRS